MLSIWQRSQSRLGLRTSSSRRRSRPLLSKVGGPLSVTCSEYDFYNGSGDFLEVSYERGSRRRFGTVCARSILEMEMLMQNIVEQQRVMAEAINMMVRNGATGAGLATTIVTLRRSHRSRPHGSVAAHA